MVEGIKLKIERPLSREEEIMYFERIKSGDSDAKKEFTLKNLGLVVTSLKNYIDSRVPFDDLFQNGVVGLLNAIDKFDPDKGYKFSTYASVVIKGFILNGIKANDVNNNLNVSFNTFAIDDTFNTSCLEYEAYDKKYDVVDIAESHSLDRAVDQLIDTSKLTDRQRQFIDLYYFQNMTIREITKQMGVSDTRVRNLESSILKKLRQSPDILKLASYLDNQKEALKNIEWFNDKYGQEIKANKVLRYVKNEGSE